MAGPTGLEPATSSVTGKRDNQLHYGPVSSILNARALGGQRRTAVMTEAALAVGTA